MKKVYSNYNTIMAGYVHSLLEANNIECHLRNMTLAGGIGELPINECWPEIWVNNDSDQPVAERLIKEAFATAKENVAWQCKCGEVIDGQFGICWSCGNEKTTA